MPADISVASTTDSQADVNKAAGLDPEFKPESEETEPKPIPATIEAEEKPKEEAKDAKESEETEEPKQPSRGGFQKRIDKLTRRNYELEEMLERNSRHLEDVLGRIEQLRGTQPGTQQPVATAPEKPTVEKFKTYEEYMEALADWKADQRFQSYQRQQQEQAQLAAQQSEQQRLQQVFNNYNRAANVARETYDDFDETVNRSDIEIPQSVQLAVFETPNGPDIAYYLGKHPELCQELMQMSDVQAVMEVSRISDGLMQKPEEGQDKANGNGQQPPPRRQSAAPAPIKPIGGGVHGGNSLPLDQVDYRDYRRIRDQQVKNRYRNG